jgi:hypothetical protein
MDNISMSALRYFINAELSKNEWKVLGVMLEKGNDQRITLEDFEQETGIQPPNTIKAIDGLRRKGVITFTGKHSKSGRQYSVLYKPSEDEDGLQPAKHIFLMVPKGTTEEASRKPKVATEAFEELAPKLKPLTDEVEIDGKKMWKRVREIMNAKKEEGAWSREQ